MATPKHKLDERKEKILDLLKQRKHMTTARIAEECKVCGRSIRTDLAYLREHDKHIRIEKGKYGGGVYYDD